ncbi:hypothetical protein DL546_002648 [Coniochaeta pulveracea]|uniref:Uncharacterized protein n=1 Tax=Coniochaeta pulveracea TaxID=177199 RepID=A0A420Y0P4_9PEZI|nr:hypothetical protein DL546_002648 [Coniochaeta pulveracea]
MYHTCPREGQGIKSPALLSSAPSDTKRLQPSPRCSSNGWDIRRNRKTATCLASCFLTPERAVPLGSNVTLLLVSSSPACQQENSSRTPAGNPDPTGLTSSPIHPRDEIGMMASGQEPNFRILHVSQCEALALTHMCRDG